MIPPPPVMTAHMDASGQTAPHPNKKVIETVATKHLTDGILVNVRRNVSDLINTDARCAILVIVWDA
jgi:hypothetical protein